MKNKKYSKTWHSAFLLMMIVTLASCSQEEILDAGKENDQYLTFNIEVADFYAFSSPETRAIGTPDAGKSKWEYGDKVHVEVKLFDKGINNDPVHTECITYTNLGYGWVRRIPKIPLLKDSDNNIIPFMAVTVQGYYNPSTFWYKGGGTNYILTNKDPITEAVDEAFASKLFTIDQGKPITNFDYTLDFSEQMKPRKYSRLRIVVPPKARVEIRGEGLRPSWYVAQGLTTKLSNNYVAKASADTNGNAFYYFKWDEPTTFTIKTKSKDWVNLKEKTFTTPAASVDGMSYEIDMR